MYDMASLKLSTKLSREENVEEIGIDSERHRLTITFHQHLERHLEKWEHSGAYLHTFLLSEAIFVLLIKVSYHFRII